MHYVNLIINFLFAYTINIKTQIRIFNENINYIIINLSNRTLSNINYDIEKFEDYFTDQQKTEFEKINKTITYDPNIIEYLKMFKGIILSYRTKLPKNLFIEMLDNINKIFYKMEIHQSVILNDVNFFSSFVKILIKRI